MPDAKREKKIAAAKRKLRQFKQKREKGIKNFPDDVSSVASEDTVEPIVTKEEPPLIELDQEVNVDINTSFTNHQERTNINDTPFNGVGNFNDSTTSDTVPAVQNGYNSAVNESTISTEQLKSNFSVEKVSEPLNSSPSECSAPSNAVPDTELVNKHKSAKEFHETGNSLNVTEKNSVDDLSDYVVLSSEALPIQQSDDIKKADQLNASESNSGIPSSQDDISSTTTAEKILQISSKLNGLAAEANSVISSAENSPPTTADQFVLSELEHRNQQLAEQVAAITRQRQELVLQVEKLTQQMTELHHRLETEKQQIYSHGINEQNTLRQQLQVQMQTIGILVAEKQELQHQIHEARSTATQEQNSRQRSQDQLQDAKLRLQTLEREAKNNKDTITLLNTTKAELTQERDQLQFALKRSTKSNDENSMNASELSQKLSNKENECKRLSAELEDLHEKLSMAEVLLQQLSNTSGEKAGDELQQLQDERESLNQKLIEYQQAFEQLTGEREHLSRQYEDVNQQMQTQVSELSNQVNLLESEKSDLQVELENCSHKIQDLETTNQKMNQDKEANQDQNLMIELTSNLQKINVELKRVMEERDDLSSKLQIQLKNNERLARLNEEQEIQLGEMGRNISETVLSADEHAKLLEQSQSDKATISRALVQNKQLKQQLEEMQEGFIKLSNDKMELATELATTSHARKELEDEVEKYKLTLLDIEGQLESKDKAVVELQSSMAPAVALSSGQTEPAEPLVSETLLNNVQAELNASQDTINILGEQNNQLKSMVTKLQSDLDHLQKSPSTSQEQASEATFTTEKETQAHDDSNTAVIDNLNESVRHLEEERTTLMHQYNEQRRQHDDLMGQFLQLQQTSKEDGENVSVDEHMQLLHNMSLLQDRFTTVMRDKVEALNRVEELEHVNLQLQNECDTIGEYIALYHNQRQILKQRHHEKDEYVSSMAQERELMQKKLEKLQSLVLSLLNAKGKTDDSSSSLTSTPLRGSSKLDDNVLAVFSSEWPDMIEEEETKRDHKPRPDLLPEGASMHSHSDTESDPDKNEIPKPNDPTPGKLQRVEGEITPDNETNTASQIINLLEQMQKPGSTNVSDIRQGFGLHYMGPYTAI